jgi:hypothetical protein
MDSRPSRTDEGAFQVQAENPAFACDRASRRNGGTHFFARIGNQRRKTGRRTIATVSLSDCPHAARRGLIVEQNAAAAIDLEIYEPGRQKDAGRQTGLRAIGANLGSCADSNNAAIPDDHRGSIAPAVTVKNAVSQYRVFSSGCRIISTLFHLP